MFHARISSSSSGSLRQHLLNLYCVHSPGSHADAIRELEDLQGKRDVALAVASSLVQLHKLAKHKGSSFTRSLADRAIRHHLVLISPS